MSTHIPKATDSVAAWFAPELAERLEAAGLPTLRALIERINDSRTYWWYAVAGIGVTKSQRIVEWLSDHEHALGMTITRRELPCRSKPAQPPIPVRTLTPSFWPPSNIGPPPFAA